MGLDMYLYARKYVSGWSWNPDAERGEFRRTLAALGVDPALVAEDSPHANIEICIGYWRKANQIHGWFVREVQGGEDECRLSYVDRQRLVELRDLCQRLLNTREAITVGAASERAEEVLPPTSGFFFGGSDIDEYYWQDIEHTVEVCNRALESFDGYDLYYRSSW